jgi:putative ABC transport system permease protein
MPYAQAVREDGLIPAAMTLLVKTRANTDGAAREIRTLAQDQDPNVRVGQVQPLEEVLAGSIANFRATIRVFLSFAVAAILLAAIGIYGLVSYWVTQRTYEIGLRVAPYGIAAGVIAALAATRFLASLRYGVGATDPSTFAAVTMLVLGVAITATAVPAWRASRIDPIKSLRVD